MNEGQVEEVWKTVPEYPDYEVSSLGRVKSHRTGSPKILKGYLNKRKGSASRQFSLFRGAGEEKDTIWITTLVMGTFVGPTPPGYIIKHKDGDTLNDALSNLVFAKPTGGRLKGSRNRHNRHGCAKTLNEVLAILKSDDPDKINQACRLIQGHLNKK